MLLENGEPEFASFTLMRELAITEVVTTDQHFRIAGFTVLPDRR